MLANNRETTVKTYADDVNSFGGLSEGTFDQAVHLPIAHRLISGLAPLLEATPKTRGLLTREKTTNKPAEELIIGDYRVTREENAFLNNVLVFERIPGEDSTDVNSHQVRLTYRRPQGNPIKIMESDILKSRSLVKVKNTVFNGSVAKKTVLFRAGFGA